MAATQAAARLAGGRLLRADERALLGAAGGVFALASAGAAMSASASDALFLAELGPAHLGAAVAVSSALLAVVLAVVGGLADRLERRRVLATLALVSGVTLVGLAALAAVAPRAAAALALVGGKQLAAATDLAFWVVIAERVDARRSQRLVPIIAAAGGAGAAAGAVLVVPLAAAAGARVVLACAGALLVLASLGASRLAVTRRVSPRALPRTAEALGASPVERGPAAAPRGAASIAGAPALVVRAWRDGARAVRRHALARHLAIVVGLAGVFGALAYFALGVAVAARGGSAGELAVLLGGVRGGAQVLTLVVQLVVAPRVLARLGTGPALALAPLVALASGLGLVVAPVLAVAIATQVSARVLDAGVESPAEKLAQALLPTAVRGRIGGFLDGTAKRAGAVVGGLIAAALAGAPGAFYALTAVCAALWLLAAARIARALPSLAVEHVASAGRAAEAEADAAVDARAIQLLVRELAGGRPERPAEVLVRLHARGRVDAVAPLVHAATERGGVAVWRALIAVLDAPAEAHAPVLEVAIARVPSTERALAVRALGLVGGAPAAAVAAWRDDPDAAIVLAAEVAALRLAGDHAAARALLGDAVRDTGATARAAIDELCAELARGLATGDDARALEAARHLARALRRRRGDHASRIDALDALGRVVDTYRDRRDAELSLLRSELLDLVRERVEAAATGDGAAETAAALRLYGELLEGADAVDPDDLRRVARALGEPDDDVRGAAEAVLVALGPVAAGELIETAAWGRRRARDRAAALLAELPVTPAALDRLIDAELDALDQTHAALAILDQPGDALLARRLDERLHEIAHTVLLLVAARRRSRAIARAAVAWRHARGAQERARTLAVIEAALPRALVGRLVEAVDELTPAERAAQLAAADVAPPSRDALIRAELAGRDRLARAIVLDLLGAAGRSAHRATITDAARAEALAVSPVELLRRVVTEPDQEGDAEMPSRVETLLALSRVPLLASLSTRQLADVAERARWSTVREGSVVLTAGDLLDALILVEDGELCAGERAIGKGEVVDELACFAPITLADDLRAARPTRLVRLERVDVEELVDDVPGLAAAVCRGLGERARRAP